MAKGVNTCSPGATGRIIDLCSEKGLPRCPHLLPIKTSRRNDLGNATQPVNGIARTRTQVLSMTYCLLSTYYVLHIHFSEKKTGAQRGELFKATRPPRIELGFKPENVWFGNLNTYPLHLTASQPGLQRLWNSSPVATHTLLRENWNVLTFKR